MDTTGVFGWYSPTQKRIHSVVERSWDRDPYTNTWWYVDAGHIIEVTMVNTDPHSSGTTFMDMVCVGQVIRPYVKL